MAMNLYLLFNGNCRQALDFYANAFSSTPFEVTEYGDNQTSEAYMVNEDAKKLILHARLDMDGDLVMFGDVPPGMSHIEGNNINIAYNSNDEDRLKGIFQSLSEGGNVTLPLQETFWSKLYGSVIDQFGITWLFNLNEE